MGRQFGLYLSGMEDSEHIPFKAFELDGENTAS